MAGTDSRTQAPQALLDAMEHPVRHDAGLVSARQ
jgi:hypothetical protein